jgi:hypothetical protein
MLSTAIACTPGASLTLAEAVAEGKRISHCFSWTSCALCTAHPVVGSPGMLLIHATSASVSTAPRGLSPRGFARWINSLTNFDPKRAFATFSLC